ncbi:MAG TPA: exo-beta-N-acetylmuramidase NamZ domain-containing protein [Thermoanaerobaculia bacterium]|nr:exo-beta-N-acetylmuramidase NamZ domain-containing protein [Thermoanaerobaculia bacterium]
MSASRLNRIDSVVENSIRSKECPGAVVLVGRHGKIVFRKAYGHRAVLPALEPMTPDTVFDLASLTKVVATATSVMALVEDGKLRLQDRVAKHIPEFASGGGARDRVTVEQLLTHRAGLAADDPMDLYTGTKKEIFERKYRQPLANLPGARFVYSDVGDEVLGELVERVSGQPLDEYAAKRVFAPLGMKETGFLPLSSLSKKSSLPLSLPLSRIAPTEKINGEIRRGQVHDPRAYALGGVAGHAGLFSTADDLAKFCAAMLAGGGGVLSPAAVAAMTRPRPYGDEDLRALGWDVATRFSSARGDLFPLGSYGHTGWTGTSLWMDPTTDTFVILLSNRNHPDESGSVIALRGKVAAIVASAITDVTPQMLADASARVAELAAIGAARALSRNSSAPSAPSSNGREAAAAPARVEGQVRPGIDVLEESSFKVISGMRIGLLTNHTGLTRDGRSSIDVLSSPKARATGVTLSKLFSPEHGIRGALDEKVSDSVDEKTGLPVRSLYGDTPESRRPKPQDLAGLDAVVVDLQDAGCRFYTYLASMGYVLEEAAKANVKVIVLDRPNPIRADVREGPPADDDALSFVAYHTTPIRTGMTIGELATLYNAEKKLGADLTVVKMKGYARDLWYDETGLVWVNPSPNLRSVTQAALYPGIGILETTNLSVGRGTDSPFEVFGAPWMDGPRVAATLNARGIAGVRFTPVRFTPVSSVFKDEACSGVRITLVDRNALNAVALGFHVATALRDLHPKAWNPEKLGHLLVSRAALARFSRGETAGEITGAWAAASMEFEKRRAAFLLYAQD